MHILWMKTELLHPIDKGGRIRSYNLLRRLRDRHRITYACLDDGTATADDRRRAREYCDELACIPFSRPAKNSLAIIPEIIRTTLNSLPFAIGSYRSPQLSDHVATFVTESCVDVVVCDFLASSINVPPALPCPTVLFQHNVEAQIWRRRAQHASAILRPYLTFEANKIAAYEHAACRRFDRVLVVSEEDRRVHRDEYGVENVVVLPTGVDVDWFAPLHTQVDHQRMVFVGSMDWQPNDDGAAYFIDRILPLVRQHVPDARLSIVGRNPSRRLRALAERAGGVEVTGFVEDVRPHIAAGAVSVVPLRIGGGTRLKIFEAMAMGRPVVSTSVGAEGLDVRPGEGIDLADDERTFAWITASYLRAPDLAAAAGVVARDVACRNSWDASVRRFESVLRTVVPRQIWTAA